MSSNIIIHLKKSESDHKIDYPAPLLLSSKTQTSIQTHIASATPRTFENAAEYSNFLEDILSPITDVMNGDHSPFEFRNPPPTPPKPPRLRTVKVQANSVPCLNEDLQSKSTQNDSGTVNLNTTSALAADKETTTMPVPSVQKSVSEDLLTPINTDFSVGVKSFDSMGRLSSKTDNLQAPLSPLNPRTSSTKKSPFHRPVINIPNNSHPVPSQKSPGPKSPKSPVSLSSKTSSNHTPSPPTPQRNIVATPYKLSVSDVNSIGDVRSLSPPTPGSPQQTCPPTQLPLSKRAQIPPSVVADKSSGSGDVLQSDYQERVVGKKDATPVSSKKNRSARIFSTDDSAYIGNIKVQGGGVKVTGFSAEDVSTASQVQQHPLKSPEGIGSGDMQESLGSVGAASSTYSPPGARRKRDASISATTAGSIMSPFRGFFTLSKTASGTSAESHTKRNNAAGTTQLHLNTFGKSTPFEEELVSSPTSEQSHRVSLFGSGKDELKRKDSIITEIKKRASYVLTGNMTDAIMQPPAPALSPAPAATRKNSTVFGKSATIVQKTKKTIDIAEDISVLLARCIVVYDISNNPHAIDLHNITNDAKAIREKIRAKFTIGMGGYSPDLEYELYIRAKAFDSERFIRDTSIDDLTLLEICSSADHPYRGQIEFDKKRHPRVIVDASAPKSKPKRTKMKGKNRAAFKKRDSLDGDIDNLDVEDADESANQAEKLKNFFGENVDNAPKKMKLKSKTQKKQQSIEDEIDLDEVEKAQEKYQQTEKLKDFFGENIAATAANIVPNTAPSSLTPHQIPTAIPTSPPAVPKLPPTRRRNRALKLDESSQDNLTQNESQLDDLDGAIDDELGDFLDEAGKKPLQNISKLQDFFGENVATAASSKLADFFGETKKKGAHKKKGKREGSTERLAGSNLRNRDSIIPLANNGSKKLEAFFGDRPPPELIAKNMDAFFPGLQAIHQMFSSGKPVDQLQEIAFEAAKSKRMSKLQLQQQQAKTAFEKRKTILENLESFSEGKPIGDSSSGKSLDIDEIRASTTTLSKFDLTDDILLVTQDQQASLMNVEEKGGIEIVSKVEKMLNLPNDNEIMQRTASNADFLDAFAVRPDEPRRINWIQGPLIGMGSFGKVFYGANYETGEIMAVKQVPIKNVALDSKTKMKMLTALHTEIELLKNLDHANIVRYLGYYTEKDVINVFLEYVSGGSVTSALQLMGPFDEVLVKSLIIQVLQGLDYLHEMHIIHRDIKGGNILIDDDGVAKISDFGISKRHRHALAYDTSSVMSVQGTVYWMAPEVIKGKGYSAKVDIWSLGCVVLEMLTGKHPWQNLDEIQTMWRLGRLDRPPLPENISPEAQMFLQATFTVDPKERPTANFLLSHEFTIFNILDLDFRQYKEAAILKKQQLDEAEEEEEDSSDEDSDDEDLELEDDSDDDEMSEN